MTADAVLAALLDARAQRQPCVLATLAAVKGSTPRAAGAKALIFPDGRLLGTIGGGKFEALVIADALIALAKGTPMLKSYPLHETAPDSFGAICGGEATVLLEPQRPGPALVIFGAGHCGQALSHLARDCGWHVTVIDDRPDLLAACPAHHRHEGAAPAFITAQAWSADDALVLVSRNHELDREALAAALATDPGPGYLGMIGSRRKVQHVLADMRQRGHSEDRIAQVRAPLGLDLAADAPMEIAVSILAEIMMALRHRSGRPLSIDG